MTVLRSSLHEEEGINRAAPLTYHISSRCFACPVWMYMLQGADRWSSKGYLFLTYPDEIQWLGHQVPFIAS